MSKRDTENSHEVLTPLVPDQKSQEPSSQHNAICTGPLGQGVGWHLSTDPAVLLFVWQHQGPGHALIELLTNFSVSSPAELEGRLNDVIQTHITRVLSDSLLQRLVIQRLRGDTFSAPDQAAYDSFIWHDIYAWMPLEHDAWIAWETDFLQRAQQVLAQHPSV